MRWNFSADPYPARVRRFVSSAWCALLVFALAAPALPEQDPLGPAPRSEDGRFENFAGPFERPGPGVFVPFALRRLGRIFRSPSGLPKRIANDGAFLRENAGSGVPTLTWIGHATLLVQLDGVSFLTDPIWSRTASPVPLIGPSRLLPPGLEIEALPPIDFVLVSHNHYDHLDTRTLRKLAERQPEATFLVPLGNGALLRENGISRVVELDWGQRLQFGEGEVEVWCLPAQHWSKRGLSDDLKALWASWAVIGPEHRFYFGGDTGYFDGFARIGARLGPFDLAAVPIGAYLPPKMMRFMHLNPEEALRAGRDLRARRVVAIHFGTFNLGGEPIGEPPVRFRAGAAEAGYEPEDAWVLDVGETREF